MVPMMMITVGATATFPDGSTATITAVDYRYNAAHGEERTHVTVNGDDYAFTCTIDELYEQRITVR